MYAFLEYIFEPVEETPEYDLQINDLKQVNQLTVDEKLMHYRQLANHITVNRENALWVNKASIYNHTLKFISKAWWFE